MSYKIISSLLIGAVLLLVGPGSSIALAADCKVLHDGIRNERGLMKKKALIDAAIEECPKSPDIVYQNGYIHERFRKYKVALTHYKKAVSLDIGYAKAYFSIGDIETLQHNYGKAAKAYMEGLRYEPGEERAKRSFAEARVKYKEATGKDFQISR